MFFDCMPRNWVQTNAETEKFIWGRISEHDNLADATRH
jgi:hypothetical protein